jgi:hypothetical protein
LVSKDAPKEVIHFMKVWLGKDVQTKLAAEGLSIPMVKGTADAKSRILFTKPLLWRSDLGAISNLLSAPV